MTKEVVAAAIELLEIIEEFPTWELGYLLFEARRTKLGLDVYGAYNPDTDTRNMTLEGLEETADRRFYDFARAVREGAVDEMGRTLATREEQSDE